MPPILDTKCLALNYLFSTATSLQISACIPWWGRESAVVKCWQCISIPNKVSSQGSISPYVWHTTFQEQPPPTPTTVTVAERTWTKSVRCNRMCVMSSSMWRCALPKHMRYAVMPWNGTFWTSSSSSISGTGSSSSINTARFRGSIRTGAIQAYDVCTHGM